MSTARHNQRVARRLVASLAAHGLRHVLLCPGSRNTPLVLALDAHPGLEVHSVLDERTAAFIALGAGRVSGQAALLCCTSGSAGAHALPAMVEATHSRVPLIVLTADRPRSLQGCGAPQTIDQSHLFSRHARWFFDLGNAEQQEPTWISRVATQLWQQAHGHAAGPVHLNVPFDEPLWNAELEAEPAEAMALGDRACCKGQRG